MRTMIGAAFAVLIGAALSAATSPTGSLVLNETSLQVGQTATFTAMVHNLPNGGGGALSEPYEAFVELSCLQGAIEVLDRYVGFFDQDVAVLVSMPLTWSTGGAACTAYLFYDRVRRQYTYSAPHRTSGNTLATVSVPVAP